MPWASSAQSPAGSCTSPGNRQAIATIATGSPAAAGATALPGTAASSPSSPARNRAASATGVGKSNTTVAGSRSPVTAPSRFRSSTAVSESNPSSRNARPGSTAAADP